MHKRRKSYLTGEDLGVCTRIDDAMGQYAVFLKEQFPKKLSLENIRIALDCSNGAAYKLALKVFEELGAEVFVFATSQMGLREQSVHFILITTKKC